MSILWPLQTFDPNADYAVIERRLPHWSQPGTLTFITWRTIDSIPRSVLMRWYADRDQWVRRHGIDPNSVDWKQSLLRLPKEVRSEFVRTFSDRWHRHLDSCHGECVLRQPTFSRIVADSLRHFDGDRYELTDFVVMPNHVHLLAAFVDEQGMLDQCESWKHFTAREIQRRLGRRGKFWQQDGFDHLVRSLAQFEAFRRYISANGSRARLQEHEFVHYSKDLK